MSVKVTRSTPRLDKARALVAGINGSWRVEPECTEDSRNKLAWLARGGRDFMAPTPEMTRTAVRFVDAELSFEPGASPAKLMAAAAAGIKAEVLLRFTGQKGNLRPLTAQYLARKIARGLDRRIGIATRALVTDLANSPWRARR